MSFSKIKLFTAVLLLLAGGKTFSQEEVFQDGEELYYEVNYSFINIGWLKFNTKKVGEKRYLCSSEMRSNDALPFVKVNYRFISEVELKDNSIRPVRFESKEFKDDKVSVITYDFNYSGGYVDINKTGFNNETEYSKRMPLTTNFQDGLSIFYYARYSFFVNENRYVPVIMNQDSISLRLNFNTARREVDIDEADYPIASVYLDGYTDYQMVFGLTGEFSGWFSDDNARIPLKSKLRVKIGSVTVELKSWKRKNWSPPKY